MVYKAEGTERSVPQGRSRGAYWYMHRYLSTLLEDRFYRHWGIEWYRDDWSP